MSKFFFLFAFTFYCSAVFPQAVRVKNDASRGSSRGSYNWRIYLSGNPDSLKRIKQVTYTLISTYKEPVRTITYEKSKIFLLESSGYGEFDVKVKIVYVDKRRYPLYLTHHLSLKVR
jgi:transcription initiation factor IIF auxiliary subunit